MRSLYEGGKGIGLDRNAIAMLDGHGVFGVRAKNSALGQGRGVNVVVAFYGGVRVGSYWRSSKRNTTRWRERGG